MATPSTSSDRVLNALGPLLAPAEAEHPAEKLRRLLEAARARQGFLLAAGAYDAFTAAIMTRLGFQTLYGSGWQLAATKSMYPDIGVYPSHDMVHLARELWRGIEGARHAHYYDTEGAELLGVPPMFVDMEAGFGGPTQTLSLATELIRARVGGVHLENQDPALRTCGHITKVAGKKRPKVLVPREAWLAKLRAVRAAAESAGEDLVLIARTDSVDGALPGQESGGLSMAIDDACAAIEIGADVVWAEFNNTDLEQPAAFAQAVRRHYPDQMLGFNLSPSLYFGQAKQAGRLITNQQLADLGYVLQFSTLFAFRTAGLALERGLRAFQERGLDALADLQNEEDAQPGGPPMTKMHQRFAGMNRWLLLERGLSGEDE